MNKQKSTEQTKKQQKTWMKVLKIVGIVLLCLILFAVIAFGVLRALGKSGIRKNISGEAPVLESTESTEEGWQDGWIRYNGQIYAYNEDIMTFLVMGVDNDDVVKKAKDGLSGGQADAMFLAVMNPHDKSVSIIAINRNAMALVDVYDEDGVYMGQYTKQITLQHGYGDGIRETLVPPELQYVEIIATTTSTGADQNVQEETEDGEEQELASAITVLATQEQATLLAELEQTGSIHAALVFRGDSTTAKKFLDEQNKVLEELLAKEAAETEQEAGAEEEIVNDDPGEM